MVVRLRLSRGGMTHSPAYRIIAVDVRKKRDTGLAEIVGSYSPRADIHGTKQVRFDPDRIKHWLSVGAQPSERVAKLLSLAGILPPTVYKTFVHKKFPVVDPEAALKTLFKDPKAVELAHPAPAPASTTASTPTAKK